MNKLWDRIVTALEWVTHLIGGNRFAFVATILLVWAASAIALIDVATAAEVTDHYYLQLYLRVPRTYDNMQSQGYRQFQTQRLAGWMTITYDTEDEESIPTISVTGLTNRTHKIGGNPITYSCSVNEDKMFPRVNLIGSNKTCRFKTGSINCFMDADPSYSIGEDDEDNSLFVTLAGRGSIGPLDGSGQFVKSWTGNCAGTLGCGCRAYGHVSPTRVNGAYGPTAIVDDVAAVFGHWSARWRKRISKE